MARLKRSDLDTWDKVDQIRLIDAARLWIGATPTDDEAIIGHRAHSIREMLISAIIELELNLAGSEPKQTDRFARAVYRRIAEKLGERPKFLYPEDRRKKTGRKSSTVGLYKNCYDDVMMVMKKKKWNQTRAAKAVAAHYQMPESTVLRNFRRHRAALKKQPNSKT